MHAGRVVLGKIGQSADLIIAAGGAVTAVAEIRKTAVARGNLYAISGPVFAAAKTDPPAQRHRRWRRFRRVLTSRLCRSIS
jgi:hypothetical protein